MRVIGISLEGDEGAVGSAFSTESGIQYPETWIPSKLKWEMGIHPHDDNNTAMELLATHYDVNGARKIRA